LTGEPLANGPSLGLLAVCGLGVFKSLTSERPAFPPVRPLLAGGTLDIVAPLTIGFILETLPGGCLVPFVPAGRWGLVIADVSLGTAFATVGFILETIPGGIPFVPAGR
jgi:hypothetical protein